MPALSRLLAVYAYLDDVRGALEVLESEGVAVETVYSPAYNHELIEALAPRPSPVRYFVLAGGLLGVLTGFTLAVYTAAQWRLIVWGKPSIPIVPTVIVSFEFCILFAVFAGLIGLLMLSRMPAFSIPEHFDSRFTVDRYGILLNCPDDRHASIIQLLERSGAEEIHRVEN
jgi:hypothetical protein